MEGDEGVGLGAGPEEVSAEAGVARGKLFIRSRAIDSFSRCDSIGAARSMVGFACDAVTLGFPCVPFGVFACAHAASIASGDSILGITFSPFETFVCAHAASMLFEGLINGQVGIALDSVFVF